MRLDLLHVQSVGLHRMMRIHRAIRDMLWTIKTALAAWGLQPCDKYSHETVQLACACMQSQVYTARCMSHIVAALVAVVLLPVLGLCAS